MHKHKQASMRVALENAAAILPTSILLQNGLFEYVQSRISGVTKSLIERMRLQFLTIAFDSWFAYAEAVYRRKVANAGPLIVKNCIRYIAKLKYRKFKRARDLALEIERKRQEVAKLSLDGKVIKIQTRMRIFLAIKRVAPLLRRSRAAKVLQLFCKRWVSIGKMYKVYFALMDRLKATRFLQRTLRGCMGRKVKPPLNSPHTLTHSS